MLRTLACVVEAVCCGNLGLLRLRIAVLRLPPLTCS